MGFRLDRSYVLKFEGAMAGAEVRLKATSVATCVAIRGADAGGLAELLADHVVSWNLDDAAGEPLKPTAEAIMTNLEEVVLAAIVREWYKAAVGVTAPLDVPSISGEPVPELSIPTEVL